MSTTVFFSFFLSLSSSDVQQHLNCCEEKKEKMLFAFRQNHIGCRKQTQTVKRKEEEKRGNGIVT